MANKQRGEVSVELDGKTYTMTLSLNAMARLEELFSTDDKVVTFHQIAGFAERGSVRHVRGMIWAVLTDHHPKLTVKDVSELIERSGGLLAFKDKLQELAKASAPDPRDVSESGVPSAGDPPQAQGVDGIGESSTSRLVGSV